MRSECETGVLWQPTSNLFNQRGAKQLNVTQNHSSQFGTDEKFINSPSANPTGMGSQRTRQFYGLENCVRQPLKCNRPNRRGISIIVPPKLEKFRNRPTLNCRENLLGATFLFFIFSPLPFRWASTQLAYAFCVNFLWHHTIDRGTSRSYTEHKLLTNTRAHTNECEPMKIVSRSLLSLSQIITKFSAKMLPIAMQNCRSSVYSAIAHQFPPENARIQLISRKLFTLMR